MFAIAFLVIGLIIFCKEAPKFFGETLGINSGNMSLGLKKKLADGGVYNVAGIGAGGGYFAVSGEQVPICAGTDRGCGNELGIWGTL